MQYCMGLKKGFKDNYKSIVVETDNLDAFKVIKNYPRDVPWRLQM